MKPIESQKIELKNNEINIDSLTIKQKLAQMIIIRGDIFNEEYLKLNIGGIFLDRQNSLEDYEKIIQKHQENSSVKLFVATDFEGAWSPFVKSNISNVDFPPFNKINSSDKAYDIGSKQGELLKKIGFNLNFAPVAEFEDIAYGGRTFLGTKKEVKEKLKNYIEGLQLNVFGTCKHYPGKGLIKNTHWRIDTQKINNEDLELFESCFENNISAVMIGHQKVTGELNSKGKQSTVSKEIINSIDENFLIITDEINMLGLKLSYLFNKRKLYRDLINSGNNVILDFKVSPKKLDSLLSKLEKDVKNNLINEYKIDNSVKKILKKKGYKII